MEADPGDEKGKKGALGGDGGLEWGLERQFAFEREMLLMADGTPEPQKPRGWRQRPFAADLLQNCDLPPPAKLFGPVTTLQRLESAAGADQKAGGDDKDSLLRALRLSQSHAREAEEKLAAAGASNGDLAALLVRDAVVLSVHRRWVMMLEVENSLLRGDAGPEPDDGGGEGDEGAASAARGGGGVAAASSASCRFRRRLLPPRRSPPPLQDGTGGGGQLGFLTRGTFLTSARLRGKAEKLQRQQGVEVVAAVPTSRTSVLGSPRPTAATDGKDLRLLLKDRPVVAHVHCCLAILHPHMLQGENSALEEVNHGESRPPKWCMSSHFLVALFPSISAGPSFLCL